MYARQGSRIKYTMTRRSKGKRWRVKHWRKEEMRGRTYQEGKHVPLVDMNIENKRSARLDEPMKISDQWETESMSVNSARGEEIVSVRADHLNSQISYLDLATNNANMAYKLFNTRLRIFRHGKSRMGWYFILFYFIFDMMDYVLRSCSAFPIY